MRIIQPGRRTGIWPNGEPKSVRDLADQASRLRCYEVYMVVIGDVDAYEVIAVFESRADARQRADHYNSVVTTPGVARVEDINLYEAE